MERASRAQLRRAQEQIPEQAPKSRQLALEERDLDSGAKKYLDRVKEAPLHTGAAADFLERAVHALGEKIKEVGAAMTMGRDARAIGEVMRRVDPLMLAYMTAHVAASAVLGDERRAAAKELPTLQTVIDELSRRIVHNVIGSIVNADGSAELWEWDDPIRWDANDRLRFAYDLVDLLEATKTFIQIDRPGGEHDQFRVSLLPEVGDWLASEHARVAFLRPLRNPMVEPPLPWPLDDVAGGGFFSPKLRKPLVRRLEGVPRTTAANLRSPHVQQGINYLQETVWRVNKAVLVRASAELPKMPKPKRQPARDDLDDPTVATLVREQLSAVEPWSDEFWALPRDPALTARLEALDVERRQRRKAHLENLRVWRKRLNSRRVLLVAEDDRDAPELYLPWYADYRGRMYPDSDALNPMQGDLSRGLLEFAHGEPLGARGRFRLAVHAANCFGQGDECGKLATLEQRAAWTERHGAHLLSFFMDHPDEKQRPKDRLQFLAAAKEWDALLGHVKRGGKSETFESRIPAMIDGQANGVQHYAALTRSRREGELVGIVPSDKPVDLYSVLREDLRGELRTKLREDLVEKLATRQFAKWMMQPWMYGSTAFKQITEPENADLEEFLASLNVTFADKNKIIRAFNAVVGRRLEQTAKLQKWFKAVAVELWPKHGASGVRWTTPSGWDVLHRPMKQTEKSRLEFAGRFTSQRSMTFMEGGWAPDNKKFLSALSPNVIHSLDAAHLALTMREARARGVHSFAAVHDCFGTHAGKIDTLLDCTREVFASEVFTKGAQQILDGLAAMSGVPRPAIGDLNVRDVLRGPYFFV